MKRFALAIALACVLSVSALAGDGHTVDAPAPGDMPGGGRTGDMGNGLAAPAVLTILNIVF